MPRSITRAFALLLGLALISCVKTPQKAESNEMTDPPASTGSVSAAQGGGSGMGATPGATAGAPGTAASSTVAASADPGWPRTFQKDDATVVVYQPQIDSWSSYTTLAFRCAVTVTLKDTTTPNYGVLSATADTVVDRQAGVVLMSNLKSTVTFPAVAPAMSQTLGAVVQDAINSRPVTQLSLERVLAYMHSQPTPTGVAVNLAPPPIFFSESPAIMVIYMGQPDFKPVEGTNMKVMFAVNTNWVVLLDTASDQYYLLDGQNWMTAPDPVNGPWSAAVTTPASFTAIPSTGDWEHVHQALPGKPALSTPRVFTSTEPAELIVTNGSPSYTAIPNTRLLYVNNPVQPVFYDMATSQMYFLTAGRWFSAPNLQGPWVAASASLPAEFASIPADGPMGYVLQSVPGTTEAKDAVLLAQVPQTATVDIATTKVDVTYEGAPKFQPITGTSMTYAVNTPYQVIAAENRFYCCYAGVWFVANAATGPWVVASAVPTVIYTIPASSPLYNVTYVQVYSATPTTVVVGYTSGYSGAYVASTGVLMFGAGMLTGALIASNDCWYHCNPCYYSYGCCAQYHYGGGCWATGGSYYGPHGGAGWGAGYNPSTGNWSRSGYAYGPGGGSIHGTQAYNPWSNTWASHAGGSSGYGSSWGASSVQQNGKWADSAHTTGANGVSHGWAENSSGETARGVSNGRGTGAAATSNGDLYAGHDGNAYRNTGSGWQKNTGSGWNDVNKPSGSGQFGSDADRSAQRSTTSGLNSDAWSRNHGSSGGFGGDGFGGFGGDHSSGGGWGGGGGFGDRSSGGGWGGGGGSRWGGSSGGFHGFGGFGGFRGRR